MRKGFTLVELSIVLVIIGLLIGGILAGQSMITTAKVNRMVKDMTTREIAVTNFTTSFKYLPGDATQLVPPGDGNGTINNIGAGPCAAPPNAQYDYSEESYFWSHLTQSKMLPGDYQTYSPDKCGGPHNDDFNDQSQAGILWPYNTLKFQGEECSGLKCKILVGLTTDKVFNFYVYMDAELAIPTHNKLPYTDVGCQDDGYGGVDCSDSSAKVGVVSQPVTNLSF